MSGSVWLGIDTTQRPGSVALLEDDGRTVQIDLRDDLSTSESLLPAILDLLEKAGIEGSGLSGIGACLGPGSYTGLRICAATASGLSSGWGVPAKGVPVLRAIACSSGSDAPVLAVVRAREGEVFAAAFGSGDPFSLELLPQGVYTCEAAAAWLDARPGSACEGPGAPMIRPGIDPSRCLAPGASVTARLAAAYCAASGPDRSLRPLYLRSFRQKAATGVS